MKALITMGPTREPIDPVRFISNASSGKMGLALAREAMQRGHEVTVVSGPVHLGFPDGLRIIRVTTAREMIDSTLEELEGSYDIMISAAAIADYSPIEAQEGKMDSGEESINLKLRRNPKLTRIARESSHSLFIVAFKAEFGVEREELIERARRKLEGENLNLVVANDICKNGFGSDRIEAWILDGEGTIHLPLTEKSSIAGSIWEGIEKERYKGMKSSK